MELLVVIAILSVMVALLTPALQKARSQAGKMGCLSNLRQLHMGMTLYAADHEGSLPWQNTIGNMSYDGLSWQNLFQAQQAAGEEVHPSWEIAIWPYVNSVKVFECPGQSQIKRATRTIDGLTHHVMMSYETNCQSANRTPAFNNFGFSGDQRNLWSGLFKFNYGWKLTQIEQTETFMIADFIGWASWNMFGGKHGDRIPIVLGNHDNEAWCAVRVNGSAAAYSAQTLLQDKRFGITGWITAWDTYHRELMYVRSIEGNANGIYPTDSDWNWND